MAYVPPVCHSNGEYAADENLQQLCRFPFLVSPQEPVSRSEPDGPAIWPQARPGFLSRCSGSGSWNLDSRPGFDVALTAGIVPCAEDRTVGAQAKGVSGTRRHRDDVLPIADVALPEAVVSGCEDPSGCRGSDGVIAARGQRHRVFPLIDVARSGRPVPGREDPPVASESDGVQISGCDGGEIAPVVNGALSPAIVSRGQC